MPNPSYFILLSLAAIVFVSGCIGFGGFNPGAIARTSPIIDEFLSEHPNAQVKITHFTASQAANIIEQIRSDCDNLQIESKEFYRVTVEDPSTDLSAVAWIDVENSVVECALKIGIELLCGNGICDPGETTEICLEDCGLPGPS